jgi:hypothetical protein
MKEYGEDKLLMFSQLRGAEFKTSGMLLKTA